MANRINLEQGVYRRVQQHVIAQLGAWLAAMLDQVDDALFERAEKAENSQAQSSFFMAMRQIRLGRCQLEEDYRLGLEQAFTRLSRGSRPSGAQPSIVPAAQSGFSLLDNDALESSIAIDSMTAKARAREAEQLAQLQRCFEVLFPRLRIDERNHPLDPAQLVQAFVGATAEVDIEIAPRLILYKLFDTQVLSGIGGLYQEVHQLLAHAGIRPAPAPPQRSAATASPRTAASGRPLAGGEQAAQPLLEGLQQLLTEQAIPGYSGLSADAAVGAGVPVVTFNDLISALSQIQGRPGAITGTQVRQALGEFLAPEPGSAARQIGSLESAAIDIVGMLFDVVLDDPRLPPRIKALLARLQIPVLKVALLDGAFFSSKQHPARRLINEMARAATGWVEPEQLECDALYGQIKDTIERALTEFVDDPQLFSDLLNDFLIFQEEEQERARLVEKRTREAAEGKARIERARARVSEEIRLRTHGRDLPEVIHQLLGDAWSKVLFLACLKADEDGADWQQKLAVVDCLVASVEPKATAAERREQLLEIPQLLQELQEGLNAILFNPHEMSELFQQLEAEHVRCLTANANQLEQAVRQGSVAPMPAVVAGIVQPPPAEPDDGLAEYRQQLDGLQAGTWFEFMESDGTRLRAKLSARLHDGRRLIFVNRAGFKISERARDEVASELRSGKASVLDDDQLFDKALEAVIANLRQTRAGFR